MLYWGSVRTMKRNTPAVHRLGRSGTGYRGGLFGVYLRGTEDEEEEERQ